MIVLWVFIATYVFFILFLRFGMGKLEESQTQHFTANTRFSLVISFQARKPNLPFLLQSIAALDYPKDRFELILVHDQVQDNSVVVFRKFLKAHPTIQGQVIRTNLGPKFPEKTIIESGIQVASYEYILSIGADYILPVGYLSAFNAQLLLGKVDLMIGPMAYPVLEIRKKRSFLSDFQSLDLLSMQAATQGSFGVGKPFVYSDVNLCFSKKGFETVISFGNKQTVKEDDFILLEKFIQADLHVAYVKNTDAVVRISVHENWKHMLLQRVSWARNAMISTSTMGKWIGLLVFLTNLALVLGIPAMLFNLLEPQHYFIAFVFKFNADFLLLFSMASFVGMESPLRRYLWGGAFYPFFISWVGLKALFTDHRFKP